MHQKTFKMLCWKEYNFIDIFKGSNNFESLIRSQPNVSPCNMGNAQFLVEKLENVL